MASNKSHTAANQSLELNQPSDAPKLEAEPKSLSQPEYPSTKRVAIIMCSVYITMFLIALDKTVLVPAIPVITNRFSSLSDIGWYGSAYMLTLCAFQLFWGRIYKLASTGCLAEPFDSPKSVLLSAIVVFEVGSAVCGAATSSSMFIVGRAIAGLGSAGMMNGTIMVMIAVVPLKKRPLWQGLIGAVFGIASVVGPLLGGAFTEKASWRWCFYINLPLGALVIAILVVVLRLPSTVKEGASTEKKSAATILSSLDLFGLATFMPSIICLLLALQWGGTTYAWSDWRIILLLTLFPILLAAFLATQILRPETATLPMRILTQRSIALSFLFTFSSQAAMLVVTYYIPFFFQAIKSFSPLGSGLATLPFLLSLVSGSIFAGGLVQRIGYPSPFMMLSAILGSIGAGLISTWGSDVHKSMWIGFQVLFGFGIGMGMQQPTMMAQLVLSNEDQPTGVALMFFGQNFGGAIFVSVAQNVFTDELASKLTAIPGLHLDRSAIIRFGATSLKNLIAQEYLELVIESCRDALRSAFLVGTGLAALSMAGAALVEWRSVKENNLGSTEAQHNAQEE